MPSQKESHIKKQKLLKWEWRRKINEMADNIFYPFTSCGWNDSFFDLLVEIDMAIESKEEVRFI